MGECGRIQRFFRSANLPSMSTEEYLLVYTWRLTGYHPTQTHTKTNQNQNNRDKHVSPAYSLCYGVNTKIFCMCVGFNVKLILI